MKMMVTMMIMTMMMMMMKVKQWTVPHIRHLAAAHQAVDSVLWVLWPFLLLQGQSSSALVCYSKSTGKTIVESHDGMIDYHSCIHKLSSCEINA